MFLWENRNSHVHSLPRKEYGLGSYEKTLTASTSESTAEIQVTVEEQQYSQSQIEEHLKAASEFLTQWFKSNVSSQNILNKDLDFPSQVPDNPAGLSWSTSSPEFLSWKGRLGEDIQSKVLAFAFGLSAEIERNLISQRTKEALARKKAEGVVLGRPKGRRSSPEKYKLHGKEVLIMELLKAGVSKRKIAKICKVDRNTLARFITKEKLDV